MNPPRVTVIMPVRNEAATIERSLRGVLDQTYRPLEIVVVDGISEDGTRARIETLTGDARDVSVRVLTNERRTTPTSLNLALEAATGDVIVRVDGHAEIEPDYVERCVRLLEEQDVACAGGRIVNVGEGLQARAIAIAQSSRFGVGDSSFRVGRRSPGSVETLAFGAYRRGVFERYGNFDEELVRTQDGEFNFRLVQGGDVLWMDPSIVVTYRGRSSLRELWRQYYGYGFYKVRMIQKRHGLAAKRQLVPPVFVAALVAAIVVAGVLRSWVPLAVVVGPYVAASLVASAIAARRDPAAFPLVPVAYGAMHLAWGIGFFVGLRRWSFARATARRTDERRGLRLH